MCGCGRGDGAAGFAAPQQHGAACLMCVPDAETEAVELEGWLIGVYDSLDYEALLLADGMADDTADGAADDVDDAAEAFTYGESDLKFFLATLRAALAARPAAAAGGGFVDLGGGKGQLALAAARAEPVRLDGCCVSLEFVRELHQIGGAAAAASAAADAALCRVGAVSADMYAAGALEKCSVAEAAVVFAYASKFESADGVHAEKLSRALGASRLPADAVVATVNRRLCAADGWEEAAAPLDGATPQEDATVGRAYFWKRVDA